MTRHDSVLLFMEKFKISNTEFTKWCLDSVIWIPEDNAKKLWNDLKKDINNGEPVLIRGFGRDKSNHIIQLDVYKKALNITAGIDPTNNAGPNKVIIKGTEKIKNKHIFNFKISHIWGKTKNPYCFMAPWNIAYTPILMDPFTGHESKGDLTEHITTELKKHAKSIYSNLIDDYNKIVNNEISKLEDYFGKNTVSNDIKNAILADFSSIE